MGIPRKQALLRIAGLSGKIRDHLAKMIHEPDSMAMDHWNTEVSTWIAEVERLSTKVGSKTGAAVKRSIATWTRQLGAVYGQQ